MTETEPDAELTGRQLRALADWLAADSWTVAEAAALLAGCLPPDPDGDGRPFGAWLPGLRPWPDEVRGAWEWKVRRDVDRMRQLLETVSGLGLMKPAALLATVLDAGIRPPWLPAFLGSEHAALLPAELRAAVATEAEKPEEPATHSEVSAAGGRARWAGNKQRAKFLPLVERMRGEGMTAAEIVRRLQVEHDPAPAQSTIYDWVAKLKLPAND